MEVPKLHVLVPRGPRGIAAWPVRGGPVASVKKVATERNLASNVKGNERNLASEDCKVTLSKIRRRRKEIEE